MDSRTVRHWTGRFGVACVVLWLSQFPLYLFGHPPSVYDGAAFGQHLLAIRNVAFTRILLDQGAYVCALAFAAGFRHLILKARSDCEWVGTLLFGAAAVWFAVTLVADGLEGGAVLDALSGKADASAVRPHRGDVAHLQRFHGLRADGLLPGDRWVRDVGHGRATPVDGLGRPCRRAALSRLRPSHVRRASRHGRLLQRRWLGAGRHRELSPRPLVLGRQHLSAAEASRGCSTERRLERRGFFWRQHRPLRRGEGAY